MAASFPRISVITPSLNQAGFIEQTILSVINQAYPNLEYIIIDGCSTDDSLGIIRKYANRIAYWVSEKDSGQAAAINKGLKKATGEILCYLNSDDLLLPGALMGVMSLFMRGGDWWSGNCIHFGNNATIMRAPSGYRTLSGLAKYCGICQPSTFWSRRALEKTGFFNENMHYSFDYEYWLRLHMAGFRLSKTSLALSAFRLHPGAKTASPGKFFSEEDEMFKRLYANASPIHRLMLIRGMRWRKFSLALRQGKLLSVLPVYPEMLMAKCFYTALFSRSAGTPKRQIKTITTDTLPH